MEYLASAQNAHQPKLIPKHYSGIDMSKMKAKGKCPFCEEDVRPLIIEENYLRRDKCQCPECKEIIYACRASGCRNYAKGGVIWDDELCPSCAAGLSNTAVGVIKEITVFATTIASPVATAFLMKKFIDDKVDK